MLKTSIENLVKHLLAGKLVFSDQAEGHYVSHHSFTSQLKPAAHRYLEMVMLLEGQAGLQLDKHVIQLTPDHIWAILPETLHAEGYFQRQTAYQIFWAVFISRGIHFAISEHNSNKKRLTFRRFFIEYGPNHQLWPHSCDPQLSTDTLLQAKFYSLFLPVCLQAISELEKPDINWPGQQKKIIQQVQDYIDQHYREDISINELATFSGYTANYLGNLFLEFTGQTIHQYLLSIRLDLATEMLRAGRHQVKEIAIISGFKDPLYFSKLFRKKFDQSPSQFKKATKENVSKKLKTSN